MPENKKSNATFLKYFKPVIETLKEFDGSATPKQVEEKIKQKLNLPSNIVNEFHEKSGDNKFSKDVAWARQYLVWAGYIDSSERGIWTLTDSGKAVDMTEEFATNIYLEQNKRLNKKNKSILSNDEKDSLHDEEENKEFEPYDENDFLSEVFISQEKYETMVGLLKRKKNIIIQGAPGVGKSFAAKRLAYSIIGEKNTSRVKLVQFHQSYSYEDFIVGFRPSEKENVQFEKKYGVFYEFCKKAIDDIENEYFFIIDEINRGNLSKIFGELLLLIEHDKRGKEHKIQLLYSKEDFYVPENFYIIGMMNTADRSLAMIDYALRRRFSFVEFEPAFESDGFKNLKNEIANEKYNRLIKEVENLNEEIAADASLGKGFRIGHSYFVPNEIRDVDAQWLSDIVQFDIVPLLEEYWFDESEKVNSWKTRLEKAVE